MENFPTNLGYGRNEVVVSVFDKAQDLVVDPPFGIAGQENLRKRIASGFYFDNYDGDMENYLHATHYSYDIQGNVHTLIQDNPTLQSLSEQFKTITYDYDLLSGNVNKVSYQKGDVDQFFHKYAYDADNRLERVATSTDDVYWEREAYYRYYRHGPLARVEIGDLKVQGVDYAYTINGWIKGVNAGALNTTRDIGKDAKTGANPNQYTAADAFGYILHYFDGDYTRVDNTVNDFVPYYAGSAFYGGSSDLYNGNIKAMITALRKTDGNAAPVLGKAYGYDQLNRIAYSNSYEASDMHATGKFTWNTTGRDEVNKWETAYEYDGNGNITKMKRAGNLGGVYDMDQFEYHYGYGNNQLSYVSDNTALSSNYSDDIDNQTSGTNYEYDEIGNLESDEAGGIAGIEWNAYGKIKSIDKTSGPDLEFAYDAMGNRIMKMVIPATGAITVTYYVRDGSGNILATYARTISGASDAISLTEQHIYGSSRLGYREKSIAMTTSLPTNGFFSRYLGDKRYELVNHLGNVLSVITDRHRCVESTGDAFADWFKPDVVSAMDYDPFGLQLKDRIWVTGAIYYRYGYNGQEQDKEIYEDFNLCFAKYWDYDSRIGRRWNIDPIVKRFESPYTCFSNSPIYLVDPLGSDSTTYLYSNIRDDGTVMFDASYLQQIADQSLLIDQKNGITFTKYKVTTLAELNSGIGLNLNPKTDLIYEFDEKFTKDGETKSTWPKLYFGGYYFVGGTINPNHCGVSPIDVGNALAHERTTHGYKMIIIGLFSTGKMTNEVQQTFRMSTNSSINTDFSSHWVNEGLGRETVKSSELFGYGKYTKLRSTEVMQEYDIMCIQALFNYSGGGFSTNSASKGIDAHDFGGAGTINGAYTLILMNYFDDVFIFK